MEKENIAHLEKMLNRDKGWSVFLSFFGGGGLWMEEMEGEMGMTVYTVTRGSGAAPLYQHSPQAAGFPQLPSY